MQQLFLTIKIPMKRPLFFISFPSFFSKASLMLFHLIFADTLHTSFCPILILPMTLQLEVQNANSIANCPCLKQNYQRQIKNVAIM
jgi:hypothetical protein